MANPDRPGGLTALAWINFILAGYLLMSATGVIMTMVFRPKIELAASRAAAEAAEEADEDPVVTQELPPDHVLVLFVCLMAVCAVLYVVAAVGYLKLKFILGRVLGTVTALFAVGTALAEIVLSPRGIQVGHYLGLMYPALTLLLLHVTFRHDFARRAGAPS
jgi:hypothetical protein